MRFMRQVSVTRYKMYIRQADVFSRVPKADFLIIFILVKTSCLTYNPNTTTIDRFFFTHLYWAHLTTCICACIVCYM